MHTTSKTPKGNSTRPEVFPKISFSIGVEKICIGPVMEAIGLTNHRIRKTWISQDMEGSFHLLKVKMNMERHSVEYPEKCMMILN